MLNNDWVPTALLTASLSLGSTLKASAIHEIATSTFSALSALRVPSFSEVERKSIMDSARRFLESESGYRLIQSVDVVSCFRSSKSFAYHNVNGSGGLNWWLKVGCNLEGA